MLVAFLLITSAVTAQVPAPKIEGNWLAVLAVKSRAMPMITAFVLAFGLADCHVWED